MLTTASTVVILGLDSLTGYLAPIYPSFFVLGLIFQFFGYLAINYALGHLPASTVAPTMLGQPLLGEILSLWQVVGGIAVLAGVYVVHRSRRGDRV